MNLEELKVRVDGAQGADRELDCDLFVATAPSPFTSYYPECVLASLGGFAARVEIAEIPTYTASIDAALALVERVLPGAKVIVERGYTGDGRASLLPSRDGYPQFHTVADTPPLAILSAMLAALIEQEKQDD